MNVVSQSFICLLGVLCAMAVTPSKGYAQEPGSLEKEVLVLRLTIQSNDLRSLVQNPGVFVQARLGWKDKSWSAVGISFSTSQGEAPAQRLPEFRVKMNYLDREASLLGVSEFLLEDPPGDPCKLRAFIANQMARRMGLQTPVLTHAQIILNGREIGVYALSEVMNQNFMNRVFGPTNGLFWTADTRMKPTDCPAGRLREFLAEDEESPSGKEELGAVVNLPELIKLMGFEIFAHPKNGYYFSAGPAFFFTDDKGITRVLPAPMGMVLAHPVFSVWSEPEGRLALLAMKTAGGRRSLLDILTVTAHDQNLEADLVRLAQGRGKHLMDAANRAMQYRSLGSLGDRMCKEVASRFAYVRDQLKPMCALNDEDLMRKEMPRVTTMQASRTGTPQNSNFTNYSKYFSSLLEESNQRGDTLTNRVFWLELDGEPGELEGLKADATHWVRVGIRGPNARFEDVGLRLKGNGTRQGFDGKPAFTLKLNWKKPGQNWGGSTKLHFNNGIYNASYLNEYCATWLFARMGLPAPEVKFAYVRANGRNLGLYVVVEGITKSFLKKQFGREEGLVFEGSFQDLDQPLDLDNGVPPKDFNDLKSLHRAATQAAQEGTLGDLKSWVEISHLARFCALEWVCGHGDGYTYSMNNYRIYQNPDSKRFSLIPHGMDSLSWSLPIQRDPVGALGKALWGTSEGRSALSAALKEMSSQAMDMPPLVGELAILTRSIQSLLLERDPLEAYRQKVCALELVSRLSRRNAYLREELEKSAPQPDFVTRKPKAL